MKYNIWFIGYCNEEVLTAYYFLQVYRVKKKSFQFINDSIANSFLRRKSTELTDIEIQRRTSDDIVAHNEKTQETSINSIGNSTTKVTFSSVFEDHNAQHGINHITLDVPYHMYNTGTLKGGQVQ